MAFTLVLVPLPVVGDDGRLLGTLGVEMSEQCATCAHWTEALRCQAFPEGIPPDILQGRFDHTRPFPGDNGVRYIPGAAERES